MKPFHTLLTALLLVSALRAQAPWTQWNIFRDSTGNGVNPVSGQQVCSDDTLWLVVDTTGMGAAGITGWQWQFSGPTPQVIYCTGSSNCPPTLPDFFPFNGLSNGRKIGIKPLSLGGIQAFTLTTYRTNGDSAISVKSYTIKGGFVNLLLPMEACQNTSVPGSVSITGILDSFVVTYGTTTIRNQTNFNVTIPPSSGSLTVNLTYYACGNATTTSHTITYPPSFTPAPAPIIQPSGPCPTAAHDLTITVPAGYTSFVWTVNGNPVTTGTNHPNPYTWIPPGAGTYTIGYTATYPCGTMTNSVSYTISAPPTPTLNVNVSPNPYCPGTNFTVFASASQPGLYTIDIGDNGSIESYNNFYTGSVSSIPMGGLPIRVKFNNGCGGTDDQLVFYNPPQPSQPISSSAFINILSGTPRCPNSSIQVIIQTVNFPIDSIKNIQWRWNGGPWTAPSNNPLATLTTPNTPGPWTLDCQFTANSPAPCLNPPTSPVTFTLTPFNMGPQLTQIGSVCASGGTIRFVPNPSTTVGMDSIRYTLPNGTVLNRKVTDTLVLTIPGGTAVYTFLAQGYTSCGLSMLTYQDVTVSQLRPDIGSFSISPSSGCPNANFTASVGYPFGATLDSVVVILWNGQRVRLNMFLSVAVGTFTGPASAGLYTIQAITYSCAGNDTAATTFQVTPSTQAVANFTAPSSACVGVPVTFQRTGSNAGVISASWNFGTGPSISDTSMTRIHTFTTAGLYTVNLTVQSQQCGFSNFQRTIRVYDAPPTVSGLSVTPSTLTINYSVASASNYDQIIWRFGDGNTATGVLSGTHTYATAGTYTVRVVAINACDSTVLSTNVTVTGPSTLVSGNLSNWQIYPNPTRAELFVAHPTYQGQAIAEIYDLTGRLVHTEVLTTYPARLILSLPQGLYTLRLRTKEDLITSKLLIE